MANFLDWNTLDHKVKAYLDPENGIDKEQKAFPILMVSSLLNVSEEEAEDSITDGSMDRGIDAVFIDERDGRNTIHVFQFKYVNTFKNTKCSFPAGEIDKVVTFFDELLDLDKSLSTSCNPILWNKVKEMWAAVKKPSLSIEVHFCGNLLSMTEDGKKRASTSLEKFDYFKVHHHSLESIVEMFIDNKSERINDQIQVVDKDYFDRTDGNIRGLICTVEVNEIVRLITDPKDISKVRKEIFDDNVRVYLRSSNKINRKIIDTALSDESSQFWYLNNGITMTCDSFSYPKGKRAPLVELKSIQIVNGGQTSNALFEAHQTAREKLQDVLILLRIIETKAQDVSLAIAESTNSQTPIKSRDLRSNDDIQKKLEVAFESMGLFYERKLNQHADQPKACRIDALTAGQAHLAYHLELPEVSKKDRGRIFSDLYDQVFTDELITDELLCSLRVLNSIESEKKKLQSSIRKDGPFEANKLFLIDGAYHVLFAVAQICDARSINRFDTSEAIKVVPMAISYVSALVHETQKHNESFSFNRFFKDARTKTKIATYILNKETAD